MEYVNLFNIVILTVKAKLQDRGNEFILLTVALLIRFTDMISANTVFLEIYFTGAFTGENYLVNFIERASVLSS